MRRLAIVLLLVMACSGSPTQPGGSAQLTVALTGTPFADAQAVLLTFGEVSVHPAEGEWQAVPFVILNRPFDLTAEDATTLTLDLGRERAVVPP